MKAKSKRIRLKAAAMTTLLAIAASGHAREGDACVLYFTWWENTHATVEEAAAANPDAVSGASLQAPGHVGRMALRIADRLGTKALPIRVRSPYPSSFRALLPIVQEENRRMKHGGSGPALDVETEAYDLGQCQAIYLGFPNWDYDMPAAVQAFLRRQPVGIWQGKTIYPFAVTGTGGWANALDTLRTLAAGAAIGGTLALPRTAHEAFEREADAWLNSLEN